MNPIINQPLLILSITYSLLGFNDFFCSYSRPGKVSHVAAKRNAWKRQEWNTSNNDLLSAACNVELLVHSLTGQMTVSVKALH